MESQLCVSTPFAKNVPSLVVRLNTGTRSWERTVGVFSMPTSALVRLMPLRSLPANAFKVRQHCFTVVPRLSSVCPSAPGDCQMFSRSDRHQVTRVVVRRVAVSMMNVVSVWYFSDFAFVDFSMQCFDSSLLPCRRRLVVVPVRPVRRVGVSAERDAVRSDFFDSDVISTEPAVMAESAGRSPADAFSTVRAVDGFAFRSCRWWCCRPWFGLLPPAFVAGHTPSALLDCDGASASFDCACVHRTSLYASWERLTHPFSVHTGCPAVPCKPAARTVRSTPV